MKLSEPSSYEPRKELSCEAIPMESSPKVSLLKRMDYRSMSSSSPFFCQSSSLMRATASAGCQVDSTRAVQPSMDLVCSAKTVRKWLKILFLSCSFLNSSSCLASSCWRHKHCSLSSSSLRRHPLMRSRRSELSSSSWLLYASSFIASFSFMRYFFSMLMNCSVCSVAAYQYLMLKAFKCLSCSALSSSQRRHTLTALFQLSQSCSGRVQDMINGLEQESFIILVSWWGLGRLRRSMEWMRLRFSDLKSLDISITCWLVVACDSFLCLWWVVDFLVNELWETSRQNSDFMCSLKLQKTKQSPKSFPLPNSLIMPARGQYELNQNKLPLSINSIIIAGSSILLRLNVLLLSISTTKFNRKVIQYSN